MPLAVILSIHDLDAWSSEAIEGPAPGGSMPYGMGLLRCRHDLVWSDAPHRGMWRSRPARLFGGSCRRLAPGLQGFLGAGYSLKRIETADVVLSIFENAGMAFARMQSLKLKSSVVPHIMLVCWLSQDYEEMKPRQRRSIERSIGSVEKLIVFSRNQASILARNFGLGLERVAIVPFGVDTEYYDASQLHTGVGGRGLVAIGSDSRRDYRTLFEAIRLADVPLTLACQPRNIDGLEIPHQVTVRHDAYGDVYKRLLLEADLVVTPTVAPAYPSGQSVVLEAMSMGRPTLTTDSLAIRDYVEAGATGFLTPPNDASALASSIRELLPAAARREAVGRRAREAVLQRFTLERMWSAISAVVDEVTR